MLMRAWAEGVSGLVLGTGQKIEKMIVGLPGLRAE